MRGRPWRYAFRPTAYLFEQRVITTGKSDFWLGWSRNLILGTSSVLRAGVTRCFDAWLSRMVWMVRENKKSRSLAWLRVGACYPFGS
jgi:hypothetical protein